MNIDLVVEAIDQQLALLWEARDILAGEPTRGPRKSARPAVQKSVTAKVDTLKKRPARKKVAVIDQGHLDFEPPQPVKNAPLPEPARRPSVVAQRASEKSSNEKRQKRSQEPKGSRTPVVLAAVTSRALSSSVPSAPVVISPASIVREQEERKAKAISVLAVAPPPKTGLDALIEEASARSGRQKI